MKYLLVNKYGIVKSICDERIEYDEDIFDMVETTEDNSDGYTCTYKDNKLVKEKIKDPTEEKKQMKDKLKTATSIKDIKEILQTIL